VDVGLADNVGDIHRSQRDHHIVARLVSFENATDRPVDHEKHFARCEFIRMRRMCIDGPNEPG
jgi:hypothetical protein